MNKIYIIEEMNEWDGGYYSADIPLENAPFFRTKKAAQLYIEKLLGAPMTDYCRREWTKNLSIRAFDTEDADSFLANFIEAHKDVESIEESAAYSKTLKAFLDTPVPILADSYMKIKDTDE